jgi:aldehyde dehydrogenase (NAD(P)+)
MRGGISSNLGNSLADEVQAERPPSTPAELDRALDRLGDHAWLVGHLPPLARARLLRALGRRFQEVAARMVALECRAKGLAESDVRSGQPGFDGPAIIVRYLSELATTLSDGPSLGVEREISGRRVLDLLPRGAYESVLFPGWKAQALFGPQSEAGRTRLRPAELVRNVSEVALVLGAGNVGSIGILDAMQQVFVFGRACLLKLSPVNAYLGPLFELALAPLVRAGFLEFAYGGAEVGAYLSTHPAVDAIHVTGSHETHETIVWGATAAERSERKARGQPLSSKHVTSELGNVGPAVIVPGAWSERELSHAAESIAGSFSFNAGFNCNATKLIVTPRGFPHRERLLDAIAAVLDRTPTRIPFYPGARENYRRFTQSVPRLRTLGQPAAGELAWAFVSELEPNSDALCFREEPFCSVLSEVSLPTADAVEFLAQATAFLNERVRGTLNAMLLVPRAVSADPTLAAAVERATTELRYGSVCINVWPAVSYGVGTLPWGGHPSDSLERVESGLGWGHNALLLEGVEKTVLTGSVLPLVKPLWYSSHRSLDRLARDYTWFSAKPGAWRLARLAAAALAG